MQRLRVAARRSAAAIALMMLTRPAIAEPPRPRLVEGDVTLEYRRDASAASCPDEPALRERAADAFDFHDPFVPAGRSATSHMRVEIARAGDVYTGTVRVVDDSGATLASSEEHHADCDALVWVLGHRVALAILRRPPAAPISETARSPAAPAPSAPTCDARCMDEVARRVAAQSARTASETTLTAGAGGLFTVAFADEVGPGIWLGLSAQRGWLSLGVEGRGAFPASALTYEPGRRSYVTTISGALVPCARFKLVSGCALVEAGSLLFTIPGHASAETGFLFAVGPRFAVDVPIAAGLSARVFAEASLHPYLPVFRVRLTTAPDSPIVTWVMPVASVLFGAGFTWTR